MQNQAHTATMDRFEAACNAKRREMHGPNWQTLNWYGQPLTTAPARREGKSVCSRFGVNEHSTLDRIGTGCA